MGRGLIDDGVEVGSMQTEALDDLTERNDWLAGLEMNVQFFEHGAQIQLCMT